MTRRFQFSVRTLLIVTACIGAVLASFLARSSWIVILGIRSALVVAFGLAIVMLVNGGRRMRAFGAGAALPVSVGAFLALKPLFFEVSRNAIRNGDENLGRLTELNLPYDGWLVDLRFRAGFLLVLAAVAGAAGLALTELGQSRRNDD